MKSNTPNYNPAAASDVFTAFRQIIKTYLSDFLFTADPVVVTEVGEDGRLTVRPVVRQRTTGGDALAITAADSVHNIRPLYFVGGGAELSFEAAVGDFGLLIACKSDVTEYADTHAEADGGLRQFSLSNGFFLPVDFLPAKAAKLTISRAKKDGVTSSIVLDDNGISVTTTGALAVSANSATVTATEAVEVSAKSAKITADSVSLGGDGGAAVARVGDAVSVTVSSGSSAGEWTGTITAGSAKVTAQ